MCIVSTADNVIRPLVISGATQIPFLLIMFGVLGGIASFGLVGVFIGPVILAVLLAIWREWLHESNLNEPLMMPKATMAHEVEPKKNSVCAATRHRNHKTDWLKQIKTFKYRFSIVLLVLLCFNRFRKAE